MEGEILAVVSTSIGDVATARREVRGFGSERASSVSSESDVRAARTVVTVRSFVSGLGDIHGPVGLTQRPGPSSPLRDDSAGACEANPRCSVDLRLHPDAQLPRRGSPEVALPSLSGSGLTGTTAGPNTQHGSSWRGDSADATKTLLAGRGGGGSAFAGIAEEVADAIDH